MEKLYSSSFFIYLFLPKLRAVTKIQASFFPYDFRHLHILIDLQVRVIEQKCLRTYLWILSKKKRKKNQHVRPKKRPHLFSIVKVNLMAKSYWISAELILLLLYFLTNRLDSATLVKYSHHCGEEALYPWQIYRDFCWRFLWVLMCWNIFMTQSQQK